MFALLAVLSSATIGVALDSAPEIEPEVSMGRWQESTAKLEHLVLRAGRRAYRGPRLLVNRFPFLVAANEAEKRERRGYELRIKNAHRLFGPIETDDKARELARIFYPGPLVKSAANFDKLRAAARRLQPDAKHWGVRIEKGDPKTHGLSVARLPRGAGREVSMLVFTSPGFGALDIVEVRLEIPSKGPVSAKTRIWIGGPPQTWQTGGDVDAAVQREMQEEVRRFRGAMTRVFAASRSPAGFLKSYRPGDTFAQFRKKAGEPDREIGSGIRIHVYDFNDGTSAVFGVTDEDAEPLYARHVKGLSSDPAKRVRPTLLRDLKLRVSGAKGTGSED